nr:immunoglobulin heavy chain junction region [Mus musculus]
CSRGGIYYAMDYW